MVGLGAALLLYPVATEAAPPPSTCHALGEPGDRLPPVASHPPHLRQPQRPPALRPIPVTLGRSDAEPGAFISTDAHVHLSLQD